VLNVKVLRDYGTLERTNEVNSVRLYLPIA